MKLRELEALRAFMEGGNLNAAAERLNCTQPQASRLLSALETEAGFPIFQRNQRRLSPTPEAWTFYAQVERALSSLEEVGHTAQRLRDGLDTHLRIIAAPYALNALFLEPLRRLRDSFPQATVRIDMRTWLEMEPSTRRERFDIGVSTLPLVSDEIDCTHVVDVPVVVVLNQDHPLARRTRIGVADLIGQPIVCNSANTLIRRVLEQIFVGTGTRPDIRYETPNGPVTCELAGQGFGIGLADGFVARSCLRPGAVLRELEPEWKLPYGIFFPRWQPRSAACEAFAEYLRDEARKQAATPIADYR